jgi:hypothetical protein
VAGSRGFAAESRGFAAESRGFAAESRGFAAGSIVGLVAEEMLQGAGPRFKPWTCLAEGGLANNGVNLTKLS